VSFSRSNLGRSVIIETGEGEFANVIPWADLGDYTPNPAPQHHPHYVPNHGYPWFRPIWKGDYFGSSGIPKAWSDMLTRNPNTAATFSVANAFVVSPSGAPILLASANLARCLVVRPDGELYVAYRGQIRPGATTAGGWTTARFADLLAQRAFLDIASAEATNYRAVLLSDPPGSLDWKREADIRRRTRRLRICTAVVKQLDQGRPALRGDRELFRLVQHERRDLDDGQLRRDRRGVRRRR
jgi:hypothetical protein